MTLNLKSGERILHKISIHWSDTIPNILFGLILYLMFLPSLVSNSSSFSYFFILFLCSSPLISKIISNFNKNIVLTNQRFFIESGILLKKNQEIPIQGIRALEIHQGVIQRIWGAADIKILTPNESTFFIKQIAYPTNFKEEIFQFLNIKYNKI
ncbi:PH domain-containing protein [Fluviispira multicolorata]|uniref:PH domain-containing protein n=1 Tax=Fluviispira multicolorata TaxID=2654512 RepID=A0A833N361_9BACT|nr:PH domain-containing protein [Fluviispira multicolorata]KAB8033548.1 PH domain-containing protein [Fluviispira multicolorata]